MIGSCKGLLVAFLATLFTGACSRPTHIESPDGREIDLAVAHGKRPTALPSELLVRYLRAGGVYFEWQGQALMTAPFATNYPLLGEPLSAGVRQAMAFEYARSRRQNLLAQRVAPDLAAIRAIMDGEMALASVDSLLVGHSHYDHLGDVPIIARDYVPGATIYVNDSGKHMLAGSPGLVQRVASVEGERGWLPRDYEKKGKLIRFRAIPSEHAPNLEILGLDVSWAPGQLQHPWSTPFEKHTLRELRVGTTFAFLIDFLDPDDPSRVAFRVHYQDAASRPPDGYPAEFLIEQHPVDLAVVTMPGRETLPNTEFRYPTGVLEHSRARHALVIHYEDFFIPVLTSNRTLRDVKLIPSIAGGNATAFLQAIVDAIPDEPAGPCQPPKTVEGLCQSEFTLPFPGAWLVLPPGT
jgi:hypothetical protein